MAKWILKAGVQKGIGLLPQRQKWNEMFQRYVTKSTFINEHRFSDHLLWDAQHMEHYRKFAPADKQDSFTAVELGTGWHPVLPIALYLCGASEVWTYDIDPLLTTERVSSTMELFEAAHREGTLDGQLPGINPDRMTKFLEIADGPWTEPLEPLEAMGIHVVVGDAADSGLPDGTIDFILSNGVFQYISEGPLRAILSEFHRIGTPEAVMSHDVEMRDQYSWIDGSITPYNFLRFSDRAWGIIDNPLIHLNRLRRSDFVELFESENFAIVESDTEYGKMSDLLSVPLAPEFRDYPIDELLALRTWFVMRPSVAQD